MYRRVLYSSTPSSFLLPVCDGPLVPGDTSAVKAMLEELAKNKDKIHGWDNKGSVREKDRVGVAVGGVPCCACG